MAKSKAKRKEVLIPGSITTENEFMYFDPKSLKNWAGPEHWKFRAPKKGSSLSLGSFSHTQNNQFFS